MNASKAKPNLPLACLCGTVTAMALVAFWGYFTYFTNFQIGWMAVAVGYIIALVIRYTGNGTTQAFGILGATLSLLACVFGNLFVIVLFIAHDESLTVLKALQEISFKTLLDIYKQTFQAMDLVFYSIALYEGYKISVIPADELRAEITV